jgi:hypothetical protein
MRTKEEWLLVGLGAIAFVGFALAFSSSFDRYNTSEKTMISSILRCRPIAETRLRAV